MTYSVRTSLPRVGALVAGLGLLAMAALALPANLLVVGPLGEGEVPGETALRGAAAAFVVVALLDVAVAWGLWVVLRHRATDAVVLAAWLRVGYAAVLAVAAPVLLLPVHTGDAGTAALAGAVFVDLWQAGLVLFGAHLLVLAGAALTGRTLPRVLAVVLLVAGAAYALDGLTHLGLGSAGPLETPLTLVLVLASVLGELGLAGWLLWRGGRGPGKVRRTAGRPTPAVTPRAARTP